MGLFCFFYSADLFNESVLREQDITKTACPACAFCYKGGSRNISNLGLFFGSCLFRRSLEP